MGTYELIDHTGDVGIRVRGGTLEDVFATAARGMYGILVEAREIRPQREQRIVVEGEKTDELLRAWLAELLYLFCAEGLLFGDFELTIADGRLDARVRGEKLDPSRHRVCTELKAVTYHGLFVRREGGNWIAEVIFDI